MRVLIAEPFAAESSVVARLKAAVPGLDLRIWPECGSQAVADLLVSWEIPEALGPLPAGLRAIFCYGAGVDRILADPRVPPEMTVLRLLDPGQAERMRDHVLAAGFHRLVRLTDYRALQHRGVWRPAPLPVGARGDLRVAVLGLGQIGAVVATALAAAGFDVRGWSRHGRHLAGIAVAGGPDGLRQTVAGVDLLVGVLPSQPGLARIIGADILASLAPDAMVVNFGRGDHVDLDALRMALDGSLGAAWLDVVPNEPLPPGHWLWAHPKVIVTPHVAGIPSPAGGAASLAAAILALRDGLPLPGLIDRSGRSGIA